MCVRTVRVVAGQVDAHQAQVAAIRVLHVVVSRVHRVALAPVVRVGRRELRMVVVATTSRQHRIAMTVQHVALAVVIAVVRVVRTPISHAPSRRVRSVHTTIRIRTTLARRVVLASRMVRAVHRARLALATRATRPNSAAGMFPMAWTPVRVRRDRVAIRIRRVRVRDVQDQAARVSPVARVVPVVFVGKALRAALVRMPARMSNAHSPLVRKAIARVETARQAGCHVVRMQALVATDRAARGPVAIVVSISQEDPAVRRRTRVRMARVLTVPTRRAVRVVRVTKDCHATRIERLSSHSPSGHEPSPE
jgi:hypothetical protein